MIASRWVVTVQVEDEDEEVFGPYTERQARSITRRLDAEIERTVDRYGITHHPRGFLSADCYPLGRFENWLTTEEKREARADVRAANNERTDDEQSA